jgi:CRP-like cAMP-binding protein
MGYQQPFSENHPLAQLSQDEWRRLQPYLESGALAKGKVLYGCGDSPRFAYFPISGLISILATSESGAVLEVAIVCRGGFLGIPILTQSPARADARVQVAGEAIRIRADVILSEFRRSGTLQRVLLQDVDRVLAHTAQSALCLRHHSVTERLCRWLLVVADCIGADTIDLTQEAIAETLGSPRTAVSSAATALQEEGFIRQRHGHIRILKRSGLERWSCECYATLAPGSPTVVGSRSARPSLPAAQGDATRRIVR